MDTIVYNIQIILWVRTYVYVKFVTLSPPPLFIPDLDVNVMTFYDACAHALRTFHALDVCVDRRVIAANH